MSASGVESACPAVEPGSRLRGSGNCAPTSLTAGGRNGFRLAAFSLMTYRVE